MNPEQGRKISQLIAKCWADEGFKQKILSNPAATLKAEGMELPADLSIVPHENTEKVFHLVIPAKPRELSEEDLAHAAGGTCQVQGVCQMAPPPGPSSCAWSGGGSSCGGGLCGQGW